MSSVRGAKKLKAYLSLFVCFTAQHLYLKLTRDLSIEAFLRLLFRFIARRVRSTPLSRDCGRHFVEANKYLIQNWKNVVDSKGIL